MGKAVIRKPVIGRIILGLTAIILVLLAGLRFYLEQLATESLRIALAEQGISTVELNGFTVELGLWSGFKTGHIYISDGQASASQWQPIPELPPLDFSLHFESLTLNFMWPELWSHTKVQTAHIESLSLNIDTGWDSWLITWLTTSSAPHHKKHTSYHHVPNNDLSLPDSTIEQWALDLLKQLPIHDASIDQWQMVLNDSNTTFSHSNTDIQTLFNTWQDRTFSLSGNWHSTPQSIEAEINADALETLHQASVKFNTSTSTIANATYSFQHKGQTLVSIDAALPSPPEQPQTNIPSSSALPSSKAISFQARLNGETLLSLLKNALHSLPAQEQKEHPYIKWLESVVLPLKAQHSKKQSSITLLTLINQAQLDLASITINGVMEIMPSLKALPHWEKWFALNTDLHIQMKGEFSPLINTTHLNLNAELSASPQRLQLKGSPHTDNTFLFSTTFNGDQWNQWLNTPVFGLDSPSFLSFHQLPNETSDNHPAPPWEIELNLSKEGAFHSFTMEFESLEVQLPKLLLTQNHDHQEQIPSHPIGAIQPTLSVGPTSVGFENTKENKREWSITTTAESNLRAYAQRKKPGTNEEFVVLPMIESTVFAAQTQKHYQFSHTVNVPQLNTQISNVGELHSNSSQRFTGNINSSFEVNDLSRAYDEWLTLAKSLDKLDAQHDYVPLALNKLGFVSGDVAINSALTLSDSTLDNTSGWKHESHLSVSALTGLYDDMVFDTVTLNNSVTGLSEFRTTKPLTLHAQRVHVGVELTDMTLIAALPEARSVDNLLIHVTEFQGDVLGGKVSTPELIELDLAKPLNRFTVSLEGLHLKDMMSLQQQEIDADGIVDGDLNMEWSDAGISIPSGQLKAREPGGFIRYPQHATDALAANSKELGLALRMLDNFEYDALVSDVAFSPDGQLLLGLSLKGRNPNELQGQAVNFNVNLEQNLYPLLQSLRLTDEFVQKIEEKVQR
ncbi:YdbH domain-containing protein [Marinibactrum halimedae]|uniref:Dicarboxylate transport domain-containing protein n=1 Tax=Marinibactrum halimedae TaxID=1444977 RepID=A0AA37T4X9_9GAMM|nr:YdbH domain-containing protein [Marinibactrum halimedae]MCD9459036.1 YdbH domain-containing protein [Marinibactrum halimedae]GLS26834.1 hypothetical protein GCM10007877_25530 [Marinibactrum halimedae]